MIVFQFHYFPVIYGNLCAFHMPCSLYVLYNGIGIFIKKYISIEIPIYVSVI